MSWIWYSEGKGIREYEHDNVGRSTYGVCLIKTGGCVVGETWKYGMMDRVGQDNRNLENHP